MWQVRYAEPDLVVNPSRVHAVGHRDDTLHVGGRREIVGRRHLEV